MFFKAKPAQPQSPVQRPRRDRWMPHADGGWARRFTATKDFVISPVAGRWRLSIHDHESGWANGRGNEAWEATAPSECRAMADFIRDHHAREERWEKDVAFKVKRMFGDTSIQIVASKKAGASQMFVLAFDTAAPTKDGPLQVGTFIAAYTPWLATWIVGQDSLNTSSALKDGYTGTGLGRAMHDIIEEINGLPLIPHGINQAPGSITRMARDFWEKRARHRPVPGLNDPAAEARLARHGAAMELIRAEGTRLDVETMIAVASETGWPVEALACSLGEERRKSPCSAWCVMPDGRAFTAWGPEDMAEVRAEAMEGRDDQDPEIVPGSAQEIARLLATHYGRYDGREDGERVERQVRGQHRAARLILSRHGVVEAAPESGFALERAPAPAAA